MEFCVHKRLGDSLERSHENRNGNERPRFGVCENLECRKKVQVGALKPKLKIAFVRRGFWKK